MVENSLPIVCMKQQLWYKEKKNKRKEYYNLKNKSSATLRCIDWPKVIDVSKDQHPAT